MSEQNNNTPPPWSEAPDWAMWLRLENGIWTAFSHNPNRRNNRNTYFFRFEVVGYEENIALSMLEKRPSNE